MEKVVQKKILDYLKALPDSYVIKVQVANVSGVPDIVACYKGHFLGLEVKQPSTKTNVTELQKYNLEMIKKAGGISAVVWSVDMVKEIIEEL